MKVELTITKEYDVKYIRAVVQPRYIFEDFRINDEENIQDRVPFLDTSKSVWDITIDIDTGQILNYNQNGNIDFELDVHAKVCDAGKYYLLDENEHEIISKEGYVPTLFPEDHYGDYIIMKITSEGFIYDWHEISEGCFDEFNEK